MRVVIPALLMLMAVLPLPAAAGGGTDNGLPPMVDVCPADGSVCDPLEAYNRVVFSFNLFFDEAFLAPLAHAWHDGVPPALTRGLINLQRHLSTPLVMTNALLQGRTDIAEDAFARFMINNVAGLGGLFDISDIPYRTATMSETLAGFGFRKGPYLLIPFVPQPGTLRFFLGGFLDYALSPSNFIGHDPNLLAISYTATAVRLLDLRLTRDQQVQNLRQTSVDLYAATRSILWYSWPESRGVREAREEGEFDDLGDWLDSVPADPDPAAMEITLLTPAGFR